MSRAHPARPTFGALAADWPQLGPWLDRALEQPPDERLAWLDSVVGLDAASHASLRQLLEHSAAMATPDFLHTLPPLHVWPASSPDGNVDPARRPASAASTPIEKTAGGPAVGDHVGPWRLLEPLGTGGMGEVFLAERADGRLKRPVALKLPRATWAPGLALRLERERDILATLEHPHIARLYEAGFDGYGRPWLALEYVQGTPIDVHATERKLSPRDRLGLLLQVCEAVAYAHGRLVIHRDLKPSNILVTADGQVRLLDFGIAKLIQGDSTPGSGPSSEWTALTEQLGRALTPGYASPEQVRGEPLSTASDVYSLGVVAFELLCGELPYRPRRPSMAALEDAIEHDEAPRASQRVKDPTVATALAGDIDAILQQALRKDVARRYTSVEALAEDIRRHLNNEPVLARPDRLAYRAAKFASRHRVPVAAGMVAAAALIAGTAVAWVQALRADAERQVAVLATEREREQAELARTEAERAQAVRDYLVDLFRTANAGQADAQMMRSMTALQLLDRGVAQVDELAAASPAARLELLRVFASANAGLGRFDLSLDLRRRIVNEAEAQYGVGSLPALSDRVYVARTLGLVGRRDEGLREIDTVLSALQRAHPKSTEYAEALVGSAYLRQQVDPRRALLDAEQAVRLYEDSAARAAAAGRRLDSVFQTRHRSALLSLGVQQQTGGALRRSLTTLTAAAERSAAIVGADSLDTVNVRTRRLYSLLALGQFEDVVRESSALIEANARFDAASPTLVPQVRLYLVPALSAMGRHADAEQQALAAIDERARQPNPIVSPRMDTFRGLLWVTRLNARPSADAVRELEAMVHAGEGIPSSRMLWSTTLVQACLALADHACAERQAELAASIAKGPAASPQMRLQQLIAAAQLTGAHTPPAQLEALLSALQTSEAAAESDLDRARSAWARALALHHSGRTAEAAAALRGQAVAIAALPHAGLRAQVDALTAAVGSR